MDMSPALRAISLTALLPTGCRERTRWHRMLMLGPAPESAIAWPYSGWEARARQLYEVAAEAAQALAHK